GLHPRVRPVREVATVAVPARGRGVTRVSGACGSARAGRPAVGPTRGGVGRADRPPPPAPWGPARAARSRRDTLRPTAAPPRRRPGRRTALSRTVTPHQPRFAPA